jgi:hypothetical protein
MASKNEAFNGKNVWVFDKRGLVRIGSLVRKAKLILGNSVSSQYPRWASILLSLIGPAIPPKTFYCFISKLNVRSEGLLT